MSLLISECENLEIAGTGTCFPSGPGAVLANSDLWRELLGSDYEKLLAARGWDAEFPETRYGVARRHWVREPEQHAGSLAAAAAVSALKDADVCGADLDVIVTATSTPPRITSSLAGYVGRVLGVSVASFDVRAGGAGGLFAWMTAVQFLQRDASLALVVAAETPSRYANRDDLKTTSILGDGAGAVVLRRVLNDGSSAQFLGGGMCTVPPVGEPWTVPGSLPPSRRAVEEGLYHFNRSDASSNDQLRTLRLSNIEQLRRAHPALAAQCRFLLPNAPSRPQSEAEHSALGNANTEIVTTLRDRGYLGAAGPIVALDQLRTSGRLQPEEILLFTAVAGGIHMGWLIWKA
jgi:acetoacetyl-CoA synthase